MMMIQGKNGVNKIGTDYLKIKKTYKIKGMTKKT